MNISNKEQNDASIDKGRNWKNYAEASGSVCSSIYNSGNATDFFPFVDTMCGHFSSASELSFLKRGCFRIVPASLWLYTK